MTRNSEKDIWLIFLISTVVIGFYSMLSPIYQFNTWSDVNIYRTIGNAIVHGDKVLYKDIFDQKGIIIFWLYGSLDIFMKPKAIGLFLIEIVSNTVFLYYSYKSVQLFSKRITLKEVVITDILMCGSIMFEDGGSVEELVLCFIAYALYLFLDYIMNKRANNENVSLKSLFILGIIFGVIFWTKYNILFCFGGIVLSWIIDYIIRKQYLEIIKSLIISLAGYIIVSVPCLLYFILNDAFSDMIDSYFIFNIFVYGNTAERQTIIAKLVAILIGGYWISIPAILGVLYIAKKNSNNKLVVFYNVIVFCSVFAYLMMGKLVDYYLLPMSVFIIFSVRFLFELFENNSKISKYKNSASVGFIVVLLLLSITYSDSVRYLLKKKGDYFPVKFVNIIKQNNDHSTIYFYTLDKGAHLLLNEVPNQKYYFKVNSASNTIINEQINYIKNEEVQFVITNSIGKDYIEKNCKNYKIIESCVNYDNKSTPVNYYLFCKDK